MHILDIESVLMLVATGCTTGRVVAADALTPPEPGAVYTLRAASELWSSGEIIACRGDFRGPTEADFAAPLTSLPQGTPVTVEGVELKWQHIAHLTPIGRWTRTEQLTVSFEDPRSPGRRAKGTLLFSDLVVDAAAAEQVRRAA
jgi:hypothetical protein